MPPRRFARRPGQVSVRLHAGLWLCVLLTLASFQFVCMGLLGELLVRTTVTPSEIYSVCRESDARDPSAAPESAVNTIRVSLEDHVP